MKQNLNTVRVLKLSEETNDLLNKISDVCEDKNIRLNGNDICGSVLMRYPFELIAHAQYIEDKVEKLTDMLFLSHRPTDKFGNLLSREEIKKIVTEVFK